MKAFLDYFVSMTNFPVQWFTKWFWRASYTFGVLLTFYVVFWSFTIFDVFRLNTDEEGWRAGNLADYSWSNRLFSFAPTWLGFFPTGEGYLLLGDASSRNATLDGEKISPSFFSTTYGFHNDSNSFKTLPVAMHYRELRHTWFTGGLTDVRIDEFVKQEPVTMPADCSSEAHGWLSKSPGTMGGKIVEAASVGNPLLWKTHEVIIYPGGTEFHRMSIIDDRIFECALIALKSGETMRIDYDNQAVRDPATQRTTFNLVGISNQNK